MVALLGPSTCAIEGNTSNILYEISLAIVGFKESLNAFWTVLATHVT